jgi:hypothetical protein
LISAGKQVEGYYLEICLYTGPQSVWTVSEKAARTFAWITRYLEKDIIAGG